MINTIDRITLIKQRLQIALNPQRLLVTDESGAHVGHGTESGGGHFAVEIVADVFEKKSLMERHRLIYEALGELMHSEIHALRIRAKSPNE